MESMSQLQRERKAYLQAFYCGIGRDIAERLSLKPLSGNRSLVKGTWHTIHNQTRFQLEDVRQISMANNAEPVALVVENIDLDWIATLGVYFRIDQSFFVEHALELPGPSPWKSIIGTWSGERRKPIVRSSDVQVPGHPSWHVDGILEFGNSHQMSTLFPQRNFIPRLTAHNAEYGCSVATRISFCIVKPNLCLILVDASTAEPANAASTSFQHALRVPVGLNRGGLLVPFHNTRRQQPSVSDTLHHFFSHPWHFHILFANGGSLSPEAFFHLLASSTWSANLRILDRDIKRVGFDRNLRPNVKTTDVLHCLRKELTYLRIEVDMTLKWLPPEVRSELESAKTKLPAAKYIGFPDVILQEVSEAGNRLERFLMDTFSLLLSTISIAVAETTREHARQSQIVTKLAFVYVLLSFVTGVFGMNVKEINGSPLSIWTSVVVLVVTGSITAATFAGYRWWFDKKVKEWEG